MYDEIQRRDIGLKIKIARARKDLSIQDVAEATKMSVTTISHLERGIGQPRLATLYKIAEFLEIDVEELVG